MIYTPACLHHFPAREKTTPVMELVPHLSLAMAPCQAINAKFKCDLIVFAHPERALPVGAFWPRVSNPQAWSVFKGLK